MREISIKIRITDHGIASVVEHAGYGKIVTIQQILETIGVLENIKSHWQGKLNMKFESSGIK